MARPPVDIPSQSRPRPDPYASTQQSARGGERCSDDELPELASSPQADASSHEMERIEAGLFGGPVPHRIGRFAIRRRIGSGGQGKVFEAYDEFLDRPVAIKVLASRSRVSEQAYKRLWREAQALANLDHPNIVKVYEANVDAGELYMAMEYLHGDNLHDWLRGAEKGHSLADILHCFLQAARGLHAAHEAGLIHRDFKPGNAMIDVNRQVRLIDFGLVTSRSAASDGAAAEAPRQGLTDPGLRPGTPLYMSPEQLGAPPEGADARALTPASDQFSFAVSLYEALYGERPFPENDLRTLQETLSSESWQRPRSTRPVPSWLHRILERALSPEPERRYPDMAALIRAIEARWQRGPRLRRKATWVALGLCLGGAVGVASLWPASDRCDGARARAAAALRVNRPADADIDASDLNRALDAYEEELAAAQETACRLPTTTQAERASKAAREACLGRMSDEYLAYTAALAVDPSLRFPGVAYLTHFGGDSTGSLPLRPPARCRSPEEQPTRPAAEASTGPLYRGLIGLRNATNTGDIRPGEADELVALAQASGDSGLLAEALYERGRIHYFTRFNERSYADFDAAITAAQAAGLRAFEVDARIFAALTAMLADRLEGVVDLRLRQAFAAIEGMSEESRQERLGFVHSVAGRVAHDRGETELAIEHFEAAKRAYGGSERDYSGRARRLQDISLAGALTARGDHVGADQALRALSTSFRPEELPDLVWGHIHLVHGDTLQDWARRQEAPGGDRDLAHEAGEAYARARLHFERAFGSGGPLAARIEVDLATLAYDHKDLVLAREHIRRATQLLREIPAPYRPRRDYGEALIWLVTIELAQTEQDPSTPEGRRFYDEMLRHLDDGAGLLRGSAQGSPLLAHAFRQRAHLLDWLGEPEAAIQAYDLLLRELPLGGGALPEEYRSIRERRDRLACNPEQTTSAPQGDR